MSGATPAPGWMLLGEGVDGEPLLLPLRHLPWRIGREADNDLVLLTGGVSRHHAELRLDSKGQLRLVDRDSRNGSFVNGLRVVGSSAPLAAGDRLHLGAASLVLQALDDAPTGEPSPPVALQRQPVPEGALRALLAGRGLRAAFQPLCRVADGRAFGGELLGRASHPQLPEEPLPLLALAAEARCEVALSQAWRQLGLPLLAAQLGTEAGERPPVFLNIHPRELLDEHLLDQLQALAEACPQLQLVAELQPGRLGDDELPGFAQLLQVLGMQLGFEHLGALPAAAVEQLAALRPAYLKLHPRLASGLHEEHAPRLRLLRQWQHLAEDLGAELVLMGVEQAEVLDLARRLGLHWAQGFQVAAPRWLA